MDSITVKSQIFSNTFKVWIVGSANLSTSQLMFCTGPYSPAWRTSGALMYPTTWKG